MKTILFVIEESGFGYSSLLVPYDDFMAIDRWRYNIEYLKSISSDEVVNNVRIKYLINNNTKIIGNCGNPVNLRSLNKIVNDLRFYADYSYNDAGEYISLDDKKWFNKSKHGNGLESRNDEVSTYQYLVNKYNPTLGFLILEQNV